MFVFSLKSKKLKIVLLVLLVTIAAIVLFWLAGRDSQVWSDPAINYSAENADERLAFLAQFGWDVGEDPIEVAEVIIPAQFDEVYSSYNEIQEGQSLDLKLYANERVKRWTYAVKNYPGHEDDSSIRANLLVHKGRVIGGDICSVALDGFMHGFEDENIIPEGKVRDKKKEEKKEKETAAETEENTDKAGEKEEVSKGNKIRSKKSS